jgi:hypothetical protein
MSRPCKTFSQGRQARNLRQSWHVRDLRSNARSAPCRNAAAGSNATKATGMLSGAARWSCDG